MARDRERNRERAADGGAGRSRIPYRVRARERVRRAARAAHVGRSRARTDRKNFRARGEDAMTRAGLLLLMLIGCQCKTCEPLNCEDVTPANAAQCMGQEKLQ